MPLINILRKPFIWIWRHLFLFTVMICLIMAEWTARELHETVLLRIKGEAVELSEIGVVAVSLYILLGLFIYGYRKKQMRPHTRYLEKKNMPLKKHLILFLSNIPTELEKCKCKGIPNKIFDGLEFLDLKKDIKTIQQIRESDNVKWSWEMPLRAIAHHLGKLETVTCVCSKKYFYQSVLFFDICRNYKDQLGKVKIFFLAENCEREAIELLDYDNKPQLLDYRGWDFESFDQLTKALTIFIKQLLQKSAKDMVIDITGGQKPTSAAAIAVTFNQRIQAQYVQTDDENGVHRIISYDVVYESPEAGKLEL